MRFDRAEGECMNSPARRFSKMGEARCSSSRSGNRFLALAVGAGGVPRGPSSLSSPAARGVKRGDGRRCNGAALSLKDCSKQIQSMVTANPNPMVTHPNGGAAASGRGD